MERSEVLQERIAALSAFMATEAFQVWLRSRDAEIAGFNEIIAYHAKSWDDILRLRGEREATEAIKNTFEEMSETLKTELEQAVEHETQIAGNTMI